MTLIEDMSETERQSWMTLMVDVCVFIWFVGKMTYGSFMNWSLETHSPGGLVSIFVGVIVVTIILHAVIAGVFEMRKRADHSEEKDERDINIARRGAAAGFAFLAIAVNVIAAQIIIENSIEGYEFWLSLKNTSHMVFVLLGSAFIGDIIKNGVMVYAYRGHE